MEWFDSAASTVRSFPIWVWSALLAMATMLVVGGFCEALDVRIRAGKQRNLLSSAGMLLVVLAAGLAFMGPNSLWLLGGLGLGIWAGAMPVPKAGQVIPLREAGSDDQSAS